MTESATARALTGIERDPEPSEPTARDAAIAENANVPADATERRDGALDYGDGFGSDTADEDEDSAGAAEEPVSKTQKRTDWVTVSVLAYSDASGEHQVLYPDGKREWLALVMQETGGNA